MFQKVGWGTWLVDTVLPKTICPRLMVKTSKYAKYILENLWLIARSPPVSNTKYIGCSPTWMLNLSKNRLKNLTNRHWVTPNHLSQICIVAKSGAICGLGWDWMVSEWGRGIEHLTLQINTPKLNIGCWHCVTPNHLSQIGIVAGQTIASGTWTKILNWFATQCLWHAEILRYSFRWYSCHKTGDVINGTQIWLTNEINSLQSIWNGRSR